MAAARFNAKAGAEQPVSRGYSIVPGDVIRTTTSGHVHIRFVDGALVSVRPDSVLQVVEYRYDAANPSASLIKFYLETGTVRGISGDLVAQLARDKFRLNTPLVAIGVKGTDFVTQADAKRAAAGFNQGAIVLAPLDNILLPGRRWFGLCHPPFAGTGGDHGRHGAGVSPGSPRAAAAAGQFPGQGADKITPALLQERVSNASTATAVADSRSPGQALAQEAAAVAESRGRGAERARAEQQTPPRTDSLTWGNAGPPTRGRATT